MSLRFFFFHLLADSLSLAATNYFFNTHNGRNASSYQESRNQVHKGMLNLWT